MARTTGQMVAWVCIVAAPLVILGCNTASEDAKRPPTITTKGGVEMVLIPAGTFDMGSDRGREEERPVHKVTLDAFLMDKYPVKQSEFTELGKKVALSNLSHFKGGDLPVEMVSWPDAAKFCNARSRREGLKPCYDEETARCDFEADGYRLPTEAEWEYACRAATTTDYSFGNDARKLGDFAWFADNAEKKTHPVGQARPNPWGLCDMHGNVWQWCNDIFEKNYYNVSPDKNPRGPESGKEYVLRGGSWKSAADECRSAYRMGGAGGFGDACLARDDIGFRCVRQVPPDGADKK